MDKSKFIANLKEWLIILAIFSVTLCVFMTCLHFIRFPSVDGNSMYPTYTDGAQIVTLYTKDVDVNDVVVVWSDVLDEYIVKRVIGMSGDHIEIKNGHLYRNGVALYEDYICDQNWVDFFVNVDLVIPDGEIFVMGDNRNESTDSRYIGTMKEEDIFGKVLFENTLFN